MKTREEALAYALSFPKTYQEAPFHDNNWQKEAKRRFYGPMRGKDTLI